MGKHNEKVKPQCEQTRLTKEFKLEAVRLLAVGEKSAAKRTLRHVGAPEKCQCLFNNLCRVILRHDLNVICSCSDLN